MPSQLHESLLLLFRNSPRLAPELLCKALRLELPAFIDASLESEALTETQPAEYRADVVVVLRDAQRNPVFGVVVEAQLTRDATKRFSWPVYGAELRARLRCPTCVLVVSTDERVTQWAAETIELGPGSMYRVLVLGSESVPRITDASTARQSPELSVLSAMAHGRAQDIPATLQIAIAAATACDELDPERAMLYFDLVQDSLSDAARKAFEAMDAAQYEFKSDFAKRYLAEGEAKVVLRLIARKFGPVSEDLEERVRKASSEELERWAEAMLTAETLEDVFQS